MWTAKYIDKTMSMSSSIDSDRHDVSVVKTRKTNTS